MSGGQFIAGVTTVPVKCKLTVSTRSSKLDSRVSNVETFEFRDARIDYQETRSFRICKLEKNFEKMIYFLKDEQ